VADTKKVSCPRMFFHVVAVQERASQAAIEMSEYLRGLITTRRDRPRDDLISALVVSTSHDDAGQMNEQELLASLQLIIAAVG
jgi:cytochrome P450